MDMRQDRQMQMVAGNSVNQFRHYTRQNAGNQKGYNTIQNVGNLVVQNAVHNTCVQNVGNQNGLNVVSGDLDKIEEVNTNCILMANLQQASASGTQTDKAPVYDSDGSTEFLGTVHFENDHIAAILGYGDLQWGNILITMVYFVERLGAQSVID
ncbi:hypothetical protein Tco_0573874 [Tanacetum coccineum]